MKVTSDKILIKTISRIFKYLRQIPIGFEPYVRNFNDVLGDSNCWFITVPIGLGLGEEAWP